MASTPRWYPAGVWAVVSAGLFLGVGAARPCWAVPRSPTEPSEEIYLWVPRGPLWEAIPATVRWNYWYQQHGYPIPILGFDDELMVGPLLLVACGGGAGLLCYLWFWQHLMSTAADRVRAREGAGNRRETP